MKIRNTTEIPACVVQAAFEVARRVAYGEGSRVRPAQLWIRNRSDKYTSGRCYSRQRRIVCSVGQTPEGGLMRENLGPNFPTYVVMNRYEALAGVLAHELTHLRTYDERGDRVAHNEIECETRASEAVLAMRAALKEPELREAIARETRAPSPDEVEAQLVAAREDRVAARIAKLQADEARWAKKAKLAATKLKKIRAKLRGAERRQAARRPRLGGPGGC